MAERFTQGEVVMRKGYFTRASILRMKSPDRLEDELGFERGRLSDGWALLFMLNKPTANQFEFRGYTYMSGGVAQGHLGSPPDPRTAEQVLQDEGYDLPRMKARIIENTFAVWGPDRLAKVAPARDGSVYPVGLGQPQWELTQPLPFKVAAIVPPGGVYAGDYT